jgi:hypothetical protein
VHAVKKSVWEKKRWYKKSVRVKKRDGGKSEGILKSVLLVFVLR